MKAHRARFQTVVLGIVHAQTLGDELFPAIGILGLRGIGIFLFERCDIGIQLQIFGIHTRRRCIQQALDLMQTRRLEHVQIDQRVIVQNLRVMR